MNIWNELELLGCRIADKKLRAAWERMVKTRAPADCQLVQEIADDTPHASLYWKLAYRAEEFAEMEQSFAREIIRGEK
jgi:hypothetical protein